MISPPKRSAIASASAVLPVAVAPRIATTTGRDMMTPINREPRHRCRAMPSHKRRPWTSRLMKWQRSSDAHQYVRDEPEQDDQKAELLGAATVHSHMQERGKCKYEHPYVASFVRLWWHFVVKERHSKKRLL